jgi:hypothetical protein
MIQLKYAHLCEMAFISQNGNLNMIGLFEKVTAQDFPAIFPRLSLVTTLKGEPGEYKLSIKLHKKAKQSHLTPEAPTKDNGEVTEIMKPITLNINIKDATNDLRIVGDINNLKIPEEGSYQITLGVNGVDIHNLEFTIQKAAKPIPQNS